MGSKTGKATLMRVTVLVVVASSSWGVGFFLGFLTGGEQPHLGVETIGLRGVVPFFEGLGMGMLLFVVLLIALLWQSHHSGVRARCEELSYRVDKLQRELMDLRAATERKPINAPV